MNMEKDIIAVILSFVLYVLYVLLPVIPAALIYRWFPDTKVNIAGPLGNLNMKSSGAFAAYIITVLLGFFLIQNTHQQIRDIAQPAWRVIGYVNNQAGKALSGAEVQYLPLSPSGLTDGTGEFRLADVRIRQEGDDLGIEIKATIDGYIGSPKILNKQNSTINEELKVIRMKREEAIILRKIAF